MPSIDESSRMAFSERREEKVRGGKYAPIKYIMLRCWVISWLLSCSEMRNPPRLSKLQINTFSLTSAKRFLGEP
jgi:hypothetical protein